MTFCLFRTLFGTPESETGDIEDACLIVILPSIPGFICAGLWIAATYISSWIFNTVLSENWIAVSFCWGFALGTALLITWFLVLASKC
jgi:hypothetical protein